MAHGEEDHGQQAREDAREVLRREEGARDVRGRVGPQVVEHDEVEDQRGEQPAGQREQEPRLADRTRADAGKAVGDAGQLRSGCVSGCCGLG